MDLRHEFDRILDNFGHYVLLQRTSRQVRCICWNEKYQESSVEQYKRLTKYPGELSGCPRCLGKGWISRIERHKVRRDNASQIIALPQLTKQMDIGQVATEARVFYMRFDAHPKKGDIIFEVGWRGHKPTHIIQCFEIQAAEDLRAGPTGELYYPIEHKPNNPSSGRVEFYQVTTKEITIDTNIRDIVIRRLGPVANYEFIH